jgi:acyl transferase domain-containing protein
MFGLVGAAVTFDTACSASLVAMHYSVCALHETASNGAVCAGANMILAPDTTTLFAYCGLLAADGRCKVGSLRLGRSLQ